MTTLRYGQLLWAQLRTSLATAMQYRADFLVGGVMTVYWTGFNLIPLFILYNERSTVAGWSFDAALIVIGWFTVLRAVLEGAINPSLMAVVERVRTGSFDFVLLKPVDAQFLVSTAQFAPWKIIDFLAGIALVIIAFARLGMVPSAANVALSALLLGAAVLILYSLWILVISASFYVIRIDNLTYLFNSVFDAARWPVQVFRGVWRFLFTFVIPLALMTTFPAMAILGSLGGSTALFCIGGAALFAAIARLMWRAALASYTSASS